MQFMYSKKGDTIARDSSGYESSGLDVITEYELAARIQGRRLEFDRCADLSAGDLAIGYYCPIAGYKGRMI
jgi:hypothetical protein